MQLSMKTQNNAHSIVAPAPLLPNNCRSNSLNFLIVTPSSSLGARSIRVFLSYYAFPSCLLLQLFVPLVVMRLGVTVRPLVNACKQYIHITILIGRVHCNDPMQCLVGELVLFIFCLNACVVL